MAEGVVSSFRQSTINGERKNNTESLCDKINSVHFKQGCNASHRAQIRDYCKSDVKKR